MKTHIFLTILFFFEIAGSPLYLAAQSAPHQPDMSAESRVDWVQNTFSSRVTLDSALAGIVFPSGKSAALTKIKIRLPFLLKDPLFSLNIDSQHRIGDFVLQNRLTLEELTYLIDDGKRTSGFFDINGKDIIVDHSLSLTAIGKSLLKHRTARLPEQPIDRTVTRAYTGIIIDARGVLPVHGEFVSAQTNPCFFPTVWDETMDVLYERNMMNPESALLNGIVHYDYSDDEKRYQDRVGLRPLRIIAQKVYGINRTDPVIPREDALKILSLAENRQLLSDGKVVILLDHDLLVHAVSVPQRDMNYYVQYGKVQQYIIEKQIPNVTVIDSGVIQISIQNLQFVADSAELLPTERLRLDAVVETMRGILEGGGFTVRIEGHTASIGRPDAEMTLSVARAQTMVRELTSRGIPANTITSRGFGGLVPIADNSTDTGRALNRRVEILVVPQTTYIQRNWE